MSDGKSWWWLAGAAALFLGLVFTFAPVRRAWINGWRCVWRHPEIWRLPAGFALAGALFECAALLLLRWRATGSAAMDLLAFAAPEFSPGRLALSAFIPALEALAAELNCLVGTFPLSAPAGLAFLLNLRGLSAELRRALCRRFGSAGGLMFAGIAASALAACLKPVGVLFLPELAEIWSLRGAVASGCLVNALSFVFEYLLGTALQVYLMLVALGWVRGLVFDRLRLRRFAVRRLGFVFKWALVIMTLTLLLVHLPALAESLLVPDPLAWRAPLWTEWGARPLLAGFMLVFAAVPVRLALRNDSLRNALAKNGRFLRGQGAFVAVFFAAALLSQLMLKAVELAGAQALYPSAAGLGWGIFWQTLQAGAGGFILASWVCFYKSRAPGGREIAF